jgi:hypothetical protein
MTLGTILVSSVAIYAALHTNNRRLGADIFLRYSDRVSDLRRRLPVTAFLEGATAGDIELTADERRAIHEIIHAIFELFELKVHGYFPPAIWKIREPDIERLLALPAFQQELAGMESRYANHPRLAAWLGKIRTQRASAPI